MTLFKIVKMSNKYYATKIFSIREDLANIEEFLTQGETVILGEDLGMIADILEVAEEDIEFVGD